MDGAAGEDTSIILADLLRRIAVDQERGSLQSLEAYRALYPGHDELVAETWEALVVRGESSDTPAGEVGEPQRGEDGPQPGRVIGHYRILERLG